MDPNIITTLAGVFVIIIAAWRISGQISTLGAGLTARMDGIEARLGKLETEVHSINEHLRCNPK